MEFDAYWFILAMISPRNFMAAAQPQLQRRVFALQDEAVGLQLRGHVCGPDGYSLGLNWALTFVVSFPPNPVGFASRTN